MDTSIDLSSTGLTDEEREAVVAFCDARGERFGEELQSVSVYGSALTDAYTDNSDINLLVVLKRVDLEVLKRLRAPVTDGRRLGIAPFFITGPNLGTATQAFPVKFLAIKDNHHVLLGDDPLDDLDIDRDLLCLRCRQELVNILLRMRQYYLRRGGRDLTAHMANIAPAVLENLRVAVSLEGGDMPSREGAIDLAAEGYGVDPRVLHDLAGLRRREVSLPPDESDRLFDQVLSTVDRLVQALDDEPCPAPKM